MWKYELKKSVVAAAVILASAGAALGQTCSLCGCNLSCPPGDSQTLNEDTSLCPEGLTPLVVPNWWYLGTQTFDRRPAVMLNFPETDSTRWTGANNPEGLRLWWRKCGQNANGTPITDEPTYSIQGPSGHPDQFIHLTDQLDKLYTRYGFRRFIFNMPAGSYFGREGVVPGHSTWKYFGGEDVPFAQWVGLPTWKQNQFQDFDGLFQKWRRTHTDATFELYMGSGVMQSSTILHSHANSQTYPGTQTGLQPPPTGDTPELRTCIYEYTGTGAAHSRDFWIKRNTQTTPEISFDPREKTHLTRLYTTVSPWMNIGFKMFWLDAGVMSECSGSDNARRRFGLEQIASNPYFAGNGVHFGGENIPAGIYHDNIEECTVKRCAYMELDSNLVPPTSPGGPNGWRFVDTPQWNPNDTWRTECHYLVANLIIVPGKTECEQIGDARLKGYVTSALYSKWNIDYPNDEEHTLNIVQRWYSQGTIYIADFDGDGDVDTSDSDAFSRAMLWWNDDTGSRLSERSIVVFGMGDVDGNGKVNSDDQTAFMAAWNEAHNNNTMGPTITFTCPIGL